MALEAGFTVASSIESDAKFRPQSTIASYIRICYKIYTYILVYNNERAAVALRGWVNCGEFERQRRQIPPTKHHRLSEFSLEVRDPVLECQRFDPWHERVQLVARQLGQDTGGGQSLSRSLSI